MPALILCLVWSAIVILVSSYLGVNVDSGSGKDVVIALGVAFAPLLVMAVLVCISAILGDL